LGRIGRTSAAQYVRRPQRPAQREQGRRVIARPEPFLDESPAGIRRPGGWLEPTVEHTVDRLVRGLRGFHPPGQHPEIAAARADGLDEFAGGDNAGGREEVERPGTTRPERVRGPRENRRSDYYLVIF